MDTTRGPELKDDIETELPEPAAVHETVAEIAAEESAAARVRRGDELRIIEALLFATSEPLAERAMAERLPPGADVTGLLEELRGLYQGRGIELTQANGRWAFRTAPDLADRLKLEKLVPRKLSRAAIETLAIIAYHQPVTRAEIEEIRGVLVSQGTVDILLEEGWIKPKGRKNVPGRPVMWGTTNAFLDHFGLESLQDLPGLDELKAAGLLDARRGVSAYATRGSGDDVPFDTDDSDEALEPLVGGDRDENAAEGLSAGDSNA
ncbi:MAG: SMC-Scp complex subunit ScpB [Rhodospirillaceae bacterium]|nr:SMC-Scp complex subunit ScpB [Rhodospirillaceae bacterium]